MTPPKLILLEWIDAQTIDFQGLFTKEDTKGITPCKVKTIGHLVREDKENFYLAPQMWLADNAEGVCKFKYLHIIPKKYVVKRSYVH